MISPTLRPCADKEFRIGHSDCGFPKQGQFGGHFAFLSCLENSTAAMEARAPQ